MNPDESTRPADVAFSHLHEDTLPATAPVQRVPEPSFRAPTH